MPGSNNTKLNMLTQGAHGTACFSGERKPRWSIFLFCFRETQVGHSSVAENTAGLFPLEKKSHVEWETSLEFTRDWLKNTLTGLKKPFLLMERHETGKTAPVNRELCFRTGCCLGVPTGVPWHASWHYTFTNHSFLSLKGSSIPFCTDNICSSSVGNCLLDNSVCDFTLTFSVTGKW